MTNANLSLAVNAVRNGTSVADAARIYNVKVIDINNAITKELLPSLQNETKGQSVGDKTISRKNLEKLGIKIQTQKEIEKANNNYIHGEYIEYAVPQADKDVFLEVKKRNKETLNHIRNCIPEADREEFDKDPVKYLEKQKNALESTIDGQCNCTDNPKKLGN